MSEASLKASDVKWYEIATTHAGDGANNVKVKISFVDIPFTYLLENTLEICNKYS